jgi:hypothetical protein
MKSASDDLIEINELSGTIDDVRGELQQINPFDTDITVLALQPGVGKSTWARNYCKEHPDLSIGIASKRHNLLEEFERELGFTHWYGLSHKKSLCTKNIKPLTDMGLNASVICPVICTSEERETCEYHRQFKARRACFPTEYLNTNYINNFELLFVDEALHEATVYQYDEKAFIEGLQAFDDSKYLEQSIEAIRQRDWEYFLMPVVFTDDNVLTVLDILRIKQRQALRENLKDTEKLKQILKFNPDALEKCLSHDVDRYPEPRMFHIFQIAQERPVVLMHATFNPEIFQRLLERYQSELKVKVYTSKVKNKDTKVYRYTQRSFSKSQSSKNNEILQKVLKGLRSIYGEDIGIITYKDLADMLSISGFDVDYFFNTAGLNRFQRKKALLIIGTPSISHSNKIQLYNELFNADLPEDYLKYDILYDVQVQHQRPQYKGTKLEAIAELDNAEMYDAIHRSRGLIRNTEIHVLGNIPEKIYSEFSVTEVPEKEIDKVLDLLREKRSIKSDGDVDLSRWNDAAIDAIVGISNTEFARKYSITKSSGGYDTHKARILKERLLEDLRLLNIIK